MALERQVSVDRLSSAVQNLVHGFETSAVNEVGEVVGLDTRFHRSAVSERWLFEGVLMLRGNIFCRFVIAGSDLPRHRSLDSLIFSLYGGTGDVDLDLASLQDDRNATLVWEAVSYGDRPIPLHVHAPDGRGVRRVMLPTAPGMGIELVRFMLDELRVAVFDTERYMERVSA